MPTYIVLVDFTDQGIRTIRDAPQRMDNARRAIETAGGTLQLFLTLGEHDMVAIIEVPNDEAYASFALATGSLGNIKTTTLKAFPEAEARRIIAGLPSA